MLGPVHAVRLGVFPSTYGRPTTRTQAKAKSEPSGPSIALQTLADGFARDSKPNMYLGFCVTPKRSSFSVIVTACVKSNEPVCFEYHQRTTSTRQSAHDIGIVQIGKSEEFQIGNDTTCANLAYAVRHWRVRDR